MITLEHTRPEITIAPHRDRGYELQTSMLIPHPREHVFTFFADAFQLEAITPPWLNFHIVTPAPIAMKSGALIDYRLKLRGIPINWRTRISEWEPPYRFVDEQLHGPYRWWRHEHLFEEEEGGTRVIDKVHYGVPGGWLTHEMLVRSDLERIFTYRQEKLFAIMC